MTQDPEAPAAHAERIALISTQRLFAETLGAQIRAARGSEIVVLDGRHPDLLQACRHAEPVLFLLDIGNWSVPGMTLLSHLIDQLPQTPVLVLGDADSDEFGEVVDRGAAGWLTSEASVGEVIDAVDRLVEGHLVVPSSELTTMIEQMREPTPTANEPKLTTRERDVLRAMTVGMSAQAIADDLGIRVSTARKHIQNILNKLGLHSQLQAAAYAARHGISDR